MAFHKYYLYSGEVLATPLPWVVLSLGVVAVIVVIVTIWAVIKS